MLEITYQGSVNRWECDENDHQNVRFYLAKLNQSLVIALQKFCFCEHDGAGAMLLRIDHHHIRFLQEARIAAPQVIESGVLGFTPGQALVLLSVMRHGVTREPLASFVTHFDLSDRDVDPFTGEFSSLPSEFSPRGVADRRSSFAQLDYHEALAAGFHQVGAGVFTAQEAEADGYVLGHQYMGRISDGMPNLWSLFNTAEEMDARSSGEMGGAVLEYRMEFHQPMRASNAYVHLAGIHTLGNKTMSICHLLFDVAQGRLAVSAEALGISMDLQTRKSVAIPDARRARMQQLLLAVV